MAEPLKNIFNDEGLHILESLVREAYPELNKDFSIANQKCANWEDVSLKERSKHIAHILHQNLPQKEEQSFDIISRTAQLAARRMSSSLLFLPLSDFVEIYGLEHLELSMKTMESTTIPCSAEFAIRPFIKKYPLEKIIPFLNKWAESENVHLRRLASEGTRPLLPWGTKLHAFAQDPTPILHILETLKDDPEKYVQKSVANHLNDISKNRPDIALKLAKKWQGTSQPADWIIKHGMRTLLKEGCKECLELFNLNTNTCVDILNLKINSKTLYIDEDLVFDFEVKCAEESGKSTTPVRFEYALTFAGKSGPSKPKKFQIKTIEMQAKKTYPIRCKYTFKHKTTRRHYSGLHKVSILANGNVIDQFTFQLKVF